MFLWNVRSFCVALLCLQLGIVAASAAEPAAPAPLTLETAIRAALRSSPELRSFAFEFRALDAQQRQAALRPAPTASVAIENALGTGDAAWLKSAELTLSLSQVIELGGKRDARMQVASAARSSADIEEKARQLDVLAEVTRRFIAVATQQERVRLAGVARGLAEQTVAGSERRVNAARSPHVELDRALMALDHAKLAERRAGTDLQSARQQLAATWGESTPVLDGRPLGAVQADLFAFAEVGDFAALMARLDANPDFQRFNSETRLRDAQLRLAATLRKPDLTLSGGVRRLQGSKDQALLFSVSVPLFAERRSESYEAEAQARRDQVETRRQAQSVKVRATLFELHQALLQAMAEVQTLRTDVTPRAEEALRETEYAYERGRYDYLELVDAQREFLALQSALIDAATDAQQLRVEIERLTAEPLADDNQTSRN